MYIHVYIYFHENIYVHIMGYGVLTLIKRADRSSKEHEPWVLDAPHWRLQPCDCQRGQRALGAL